ncbi:MAG: hypothetical protein MJ178_08475, partial [Treponemataceae bacterium]|nr:hypothetical protein [Treponemataceae bacterium]
ADLGADFGTDFDLPSDDAADAASPADDLNLDSFDFGSEPAETDEIDITQNFSGEFATTDIDNPDFNLEAAASESSDFDTAGLDTPADDFTLDGFDLPGGNGESGSGTEAAGSDDFGLDGMDFNFDTDGGDLDFNFDSEESASADTDTPAEGGFSLPITDNPEAGDFSMPDAGGFDMPDGMSDVNFGDFQAGMDNDFETGESDFTESDFQIPGYSDFEMGSEPTTPTLEKKASGKRKRRDEPVKRTELSDEEHALFMKNLAYYPLNLRIEIEELIVSNDFTDEVIFEIIDKVLKRISARQLANQVEKLVDKHIPVPLNYEKRTAGEYEAYKQSLEYQLKNRIIPFTIGGVIAGLLIWLTVFMVGRFVVRPVRAELLYKEGYTLLENGLYPQSEQKFSEAVYYRPVKSWFFKFARGYRDQRQYERSADTYEKLLRRYNYDKAAGLEYARMELNDLINYQRAENIVRRWILDYHINDPDAILLLGDIYLDWATATNDADRYEDARLQYATLIEMYGRTDLYLSRMMRYFIRTDNIREVLPLKNYFYPKMAKPSKNPLEGQDMVELSGYMMEKLYGYLAPQDEFLRSSIEDVRDMLEKTVQQAPEIPESVYNFGRYFVENGNTDSAINVLTVALTQFENCDKKTHQRITRHINTYRLLGELYAEEQEYLKARQLYTEGLDLFIREQQYSALPTNEFFGHLYADIADLDYFISGDLDTALSNYGHAINNEYDTPSIRYRVGYIQYNKGNYREALGSFIKTIGELPSEQNALLALGNTLTLRNSIQAARGYYEKLIDILDLQRAQEGILYPQVQEDQQVLVDTYMKASNNLAVVLSRIATQTGDSSLNGKAMVYLQESIRAWDALTRNQQTMIRLEGSNLAQQNLRYMTLPNSLYDSEIYVSLPRTLLGEKALTQSAVSARR